MDYTAVILLRRADGINHNKDKLRFFLKTKEIVFLFSTIPRHSLYTSVSTAIMSSLSTAFSPYLFPHLSFFLSFFPSPINDRLLPSTPFWIHCFHYHFPYSCGTSAFRCTSQFFLRSFLAFSVAGTPVQGEQQLEAPCYHLWLDSEPLQAARNPKLQLESKFCFYHCYSSQAAVKWCE